jgi:group I intron endonuclease
LIIYKIRNKINGKVYIGQTSSTLAAVIKRHCTKTSQVIQKAIQKYGFQSFTFRVIDTAPTREVLHEKEQYWIRYYNSIAPNGYNITEGGDGVVGAKHNLGRKRPDVAVRNRSKKQRIAISKALKGRTSPLLGVPRGPYPEEWRKAISEGCKGRRGPFKGKKRGPLTEEHRRKISAGMRNSEKYASSLPLRKGRPSWNKGKRTGKPAWNTGKPHSEETRLKISESKKGKPCPTKGIPRKPLTAEQKKKVGEAVRTSPAYRAAVEQRKLAIALGQYVSPWLGRKHTEETKKKLAEANIGKKASLEARQKMSASRKGKPHSPEHRAKLVAGLQRHNEQRRKIHLLKKSA